MLFLTEKEAKKIMKLSVPKKSRAATKKKKKYKKEEAALVKAVMQYLSYKGYIVMRNNSGVIFINGKGATRAVRLSQPGSSDIIACSPEGKFVAIECKSRKGKLTERQREFLEKVKSYGGIAMVIRNIDDVINVL